jgi:MFS transporter, SP family, arabinose:H+ symporter
MRDRFTQPRRPVITGAMNHSRYYLAGATYAFLIAFVSSVGGFLFGYDLAIINGANVYLKEQFKLSEVLFGFTTASAGLGCVMGPFLGAWLCDRYGRRATLLAACILLAVGSILTAVPNDWITFSAFRIVGGIGVGLCSIASPMYINEIAPARWRGGLGFMYQLAIVVGCVMAAYAAWLFSRWLSPEIGWRWMLASEAIFVAVFAVLLYFIPESPRWLMENDREAEARDVFSRIDGPAFAEGEIVEIRRSLQAESGSFSELLAPGLKKALFVGLCLALFNNFTGWSAMSAYLAHMFESAGFSREGAMMQNLLAWGFMGAVTLLACFLVDRLGRRPLWIVSSAMMVIADLIIGLVFHYDIRGMWVLAAVSLCAIPHSLALGPLPWLMMSEIYPTRIRARAVAITTTFIWLVGFGATWLFPLMCSLSKDLTKTEEHPGSIIGAFWLLAGVCVLSLLFGWKLLPETKGRTLEEIAESWQKTKDDAHD